MPFSDRQRRVAESHATVLLSGETGSGKTWFAKRLHDHSPRRAKTFYAVNCGSLSQSLIESELFGHCKGAFSGADNDRVGKLEAAGEGTLFLDDIDALPLECQGWLLRAIDERVFEKVGSNRQQEVKARIITATNKNLRLEVESHRFREDLYFRLNVVEFHLPALRFRREEILPLAAGFLKRFASQNDRSAPTIPSHVKSILESYDWPGNIRQLRNAMERVSILSDNTLRVDDLPAEIQEFAAAAGVELNTPAPVRHGSSPPATQHQSPPPELCDKDLLDSSVHVWAKPLSPVARARVCGEIRRIIQTLSGTNNNRSQAARELGISRVALYKKLHKYGLMNGLTD